MAVGCAQRGYGVAMKATQSDLGSRDGAAAAPVGRRFPVVAGTALSGENVRLPHDLLGAPALLLVAYRRGAQGDVDRWAALAHREAPGLKVLEVPVIPALMWRPLQGWIDRGMRGGVPQPQWSHVVTVYEDGAALRDFVGDCGDPVAHATLLDAGGSVLALECDGFSETAGERLLAALPALAGD
jgi:hypothetical protein